MKLFSFVLMLSASFAGGAAPAVWAQAPSAVEAPVVRAVCKDGTPYEGATLRGACSGRGGVDRGASGQVWVSQGSKVYHCVGDRLYGKTKAGRYMSQAEARAKGLRPVKGSKACPD